MHIRVNPILLSSIAFTDARYLDNYTISLRYTGMRLQTALLIIERMRKARYYLRYRTHARTLYGEEFLERRISQICNKTMQALEFRRPFITSGTISALRWDYSELVPTRALCRSNAARSFLYSVVWMGPPIANARSSAYLLQ